MKKIIICYITAGKTKHFSALDISSSRLFHVSLEDMKRLDAGLIAERLDDFLGTLDDTVNFYNIGNRAFTRKVIDSFKQIQQKGQEVRVVSCPNP